LLSDSDADGQVELAPFFDFGRSWNTDTPSAAPTRLVSVGLGVRWQLSQRVKAHLYYARPLRSLAQPVDRDLQDDGFHFRINAAVF
jgi:hemolysin activation/secretion protein